MAKKNDSTSSTQLHLSTIKVNLFYVSMKESFLCIFVYIFKFCAAQKQNLDSINVQLLLQLKLKTSVIKRDSLALHLESQDF